MRLTRTVKMQKLSDVKVTWQKLWVNLSPVVCLNLFKLTLLTGEILVIRVSPLHLSTFSEIKVTLGSASCIYKTIKTLIGCQDKCDWSSSHSSCETGLPSSHLAAACLEHATFPPSPTPHTPAFLWALSACTQLLGKHAGRMACPWRFWVILAKLLCILNTTHLALELCILVSGTCPLKAQEITTGSRSMKRNCLRRSITLHLY